ncbi:MAG TPA: hypothetical protein VMV05_08575 [bacterium]|nr:hypothetical protein [bacterium]
MRGRIQALAALALILALVVALNGCCPTTCWFLAKPAKPGAAAPAKDGVKPTPTPRTAL